MYGIRLLIGMMFLFLLEGCKKEEITWSVTTGETRLTLHYDWVGTPEESQVPKGTSLLLYPSNGMGTEIIETGLDGPYQCRCEGEQLVEDWYGCCNGGR